MSDDGRPRTRPLQQLRRREGAASPAAELLGGRRPPAAPARARSRCPPTPTCASPTAPAPRRGPSFARGSRTRWNPPSPRRWTSSCRRSRQPRCERSRTHLARHVDPRPRLRRRLRHGISGHSSYEAHRCHTTHFRRGGVEPVGLAEREALSASARQDRARSSAGRAERCAVGLRRCSSGRPPHQAVDPSRRVRWLGLVLAE